MNSNQINSLPIVEDDVIYKLDPTDKKIKLATTLIGEINHLPSSVSKKGKLWIHDHNCALIVDHICCD